MQEDMVRWDELFAVVESRIRLDDRRLPGCDLVAAAEASDCEGGRRRGVPVGAQDLRAAMGREVRPAAS